MKFKILIIALVICLNAFSQTSRETDLARVKKVNGIEIYVMNEPLREYETINDVGTGFKAESVLTGGLINKSISERMSQFVKRVKNENPNIDAVIYSSGKRVVGVKFKKEGTAENIGIARVNKLKGLLVFVMCEPLNSQSLNNI